MKWHEVNVGYFLWIHLKFKENEHFVVGLKSVIVLYFYHGNDQNKKAINEKHKNFNTLDQMHFQKIGGNISLVYSRLATVQQQISDPFFLKWVISTAVSKCYGCNGAI